MSMIGNYLALSVEQLDALRGNPESVSDFLYPDEGDPNCEASLDIDKSWHLIHFLLTGSAWEGTAPLADAVLGGVELGDEDVGYGPARFLIPDRVGEVAQALARIGGDELWRRFDPAAAAAAEIYPEGWSQDDREYVVGNYEDVVSFFRRAADAGNAVLIYLN